MGACCFWPWVWTLYELKIQVRLIQISILRAHESWYRV